MSEATIWIFGYGSLVWRPAFPHRRRCRAYVEGFARRFWQGSTDHRGVPERPGRVVTLLSERDPALREEPDFRAEPCWGTAYEVPLADPDGVLARLDHRERGGYDRHEVELVLVGAEDVRQPARGLVYIAGRDNPNFLGPAPVESIARQIAAAHGPSGPNPEYVFELTRSLRAMGALDAHAAAVEAALRRALAARASGEATRRSRTGS